MSVKHLVVVDTAQIQPYIFGSNRLRENIGASHLVAQATGLWATGLIAKAGADLVYAGGGNVVALFDDGPAAEKFQRDLSRQVMEEAPGLRVVIAAQEFDDGGAGTLAAALNSVFEQLACRKRNHPLSAPLLGLSVTQACGATGLPAVGRTPQINKDAASVYSASAEVLCKAQAADAAKKRLRDKKTGVPPAPDFDYPSDFDELGRSAGEDSYIAIVHADGNGMGSRLQGLAQQFTDNAAYRQAVKEFSDKLNQASLNALRATVRRLENHYLRNHANIWDRIPLKQTTDQRGCYLPMRPLVFGGDDVTFVCDGRLGLALAECYLKVFAQETGNLLPGGAATACAGVAIVKSHYPFARAYQLAEALCGSAKHLHRELKDKSEDGPSCLDWHFTSGGLFGGLDDIREREYTVAAGLLNLRPVSLEAGGDIRRWDVVRKGVDAFQKKGWAERRSKAKSLREALREGPEAVERFRLFSNATEDNPKGFLPDVGVSREDGQEKGWEPTVEAGQTVKRCVYFDALELFDRFVALDPVGETA